MRANLQETAYLVTFAEEILNGKLHFLCSVNQNLQIDFFMTASLFSLVSDFFKDTSLV